MILLACGDDHWLTAAVLGALAVALAPGVLALLGCWLSLRVLDPARALAHVDRRA